LSGDVLILPPSEYAGPLRFSCGLYAGPGEQFVFVSSGPLKGPFIVYFGFDGIVDAVLCFPNVDGIV
jgi:hypothetical protein